MVKSMTFEENISTLLIAIITSLVIIAGIMIVNRFKRGGKYVVLDSDNEPMSSWIEIDPASGMPNVIRHNKSYHGKESGIENSSPSGKSRLKGEAMVGKAVKGGTVTNIIHHINGLTLRSEFCLNLDTGKNDKEAVKKYNELIDANASAKSINSNEHIKRFAAIEDESTKLFTDHRLLKKVAKLHAEDSELRVIVSIEALKMRVLELEKTANKVK